MKWNAVRFFLFVLSFLIGLWMLPSNAQVQANYPKNWNQFDTLRLQMEQSARAHDRAMVEREKSHREAEFKSDHQDFQYTREMAALYLELMQEQQVFFATKYPPPEQVSMIDIGKQLKIKLIKQELLRREKDTEKHLKRK